MKHSSRSFGTKDGEKIFFLVFVSLWQRYLQRKKWLLIGLLIFHTVGITQRDTTEAQVEKLPSKAVLYSLIPGGGQVYNGKYLKAILIMSAGVYSAYNFILNRNLYLNTDTTVNRSRYRERRNKFAWWVGFVYIYGLIDAMVDSHLAAFENDDFDELPIVTDKDQNKSELLRR
ncbi:MAG: hypothetical protein IIA61_13710 [Candidatus Marinimicrobia bacterium]|nr:hypothetical protein [Candidatus Neomarinimicrobiota bacterium]